MPNKIEINALTGETVVTELTSQELAELEAENIANQSAIDAEREAKEAARTSALAKLAALGLTEEEIAAL
jgi:hypothetical protein